MSSVLVIDDEPDSSEFLVRFLRRSGHVARSVADGREAIWLLVDWTPDVVILDMRMPGMDGLSLLQVLRSYLRWVDLPVVLVTAHATPQDIERARQLGVRHVFLKAEFDLRDLLVCLHGAGGGLAADGGGICFAHA